MNVSNHLLAGAVIALIIKEPIVSLPLAFLSHFILDVFPHYGHARAGFDTWLKHRSAYVIFLIDAIASTVVVATLIINGQWIALLAAVLATCPDLVWVYRYIRFDRRGKQPKYASLTKFHLAIQWKERPWGIYVEIVTLIALFLILFKVI